MELGVGKGQGGRDPEQAGNDDIGRKSGLSERFKGRDVIDRREH